MRVAVGLSGGVDSAVSALMLKEAGHEVVGVTMRLWRPGRYRGGAEGSCFGPGEEKGIASAAALAEASGIPHRVGDLNGDSEREVVAYFRETYLAGRTPNPCVRCNAFVKFGLLPRVAAAAGLAFDKFATGHYARVLCRDGRQTLLRGVDLAKDQSYFLYRLSQEQLARTLFPLGASTKADVRRFARERGLVVADRPDSQDFCTGGTDDLIGEPDRPGDIVDLSGRVLGRHRGFWHYTIGQRKGLGIGGAGEPYYVVELQAALNRVVVGRADDAVSTALDVSEMNYVSLAPPPAGAPPIPCRVKVRSAGKLVPAFLEGTRCTFPAGIAGVAPGQSAVFYAAEGEDVLCGGEIARCMSAGGPRTARP